MIHLFKKIYVTTDNIIDPKFDRIVVSQNNGFNLLEDLQKILSGQLIAYGLEWDDILGKDKNDKGYLDKKFFTSSKYRKISLSHLFDIIKARLNEIIDLIYLKNINLNYLRKDNKSIFLSIEDPVIKKNLYFPIETEPGDHLYERQNPQKVI